ncbi:formyltransferase family protein [Halomicrococcus sp. NG-SE-24]|uniref:formyltransferase family protein n=1 Tax=Halomicrococcus sp. NG-SE-24 TaxID=3436928 RepID=UPI003D967B4D
MPPSNHLSEESTTSSPQVKQGNPERQTVLDSSQQDILHVGILLPGETIPTWQKRAIEKMVAETDVEITHLVIRDDSSPMNLSEYLEESFPGGLLTYLQLCYMRLNSHALWSLLGIARQLADTPEYREPTPINSIAGFDDTDRIYCEAVTDTDFGNHLPDQVTETVGENTDVVIRFGFGIFTDPLLSKPTHGVLSFHRGDLRAYRGQPGGLWEFLHDEPTAGVTLQRISDSLDAGEIVVEDEVPIDNADTWREVERHQIAVCEEMLVTAIERLQDPDFEPSTPETLGEVYTIPRGMDALAYAGKTIGGILRR